MRSVSKEVSKRTVAFTLPVVVYDLCVSAAQSSGQSLAGFLRMGTMAYVRRWKAPAGAVEGAGQICGQCQLPANQCKRPAQHRDSGMWGMVED
jgi:hypothetical protein